MYEGTAMFSAFINVATISLNTKPRFHLLIIIISSLFCGPGCSKGQLGPAVDRGMPAHR